MSRCRPADDEAGQRDHHREAQPRLPTISLGVRTAVAAQGPLHVSQELFAGSRGGKAPSGLKAL